MSRQQSSSAGRSSSSQQQPPPPPPQQQQQQQQSLQPPRDAAVHLSAGTLSLSPLRDYYRQSLQDSLNLLGGNKALVLDKALSGPLNLICEPEWLRQQSIEAMHLLSDGELYTSSVHLVYIIRPTLANMRVIATHILAHKDDRKEHVYTVIMCPRKTLLAESELEARGVYGDIRHIGEFPLELIPFESDLLSMQYEPAFKEIFIDNDPSSLYSVARSLMRLQTLFGLFPSVRGKGAMSHRVWNIMQQMRATTHQQLTQPNTKRPYIYQCLLIDRNVDLITPMLTPATYEGLIDELFTIHNTIVDVDASIVGSKSDGKKKLALNNADVVFKEIRDMPFRVLGPYLHKKAADIQSTYNERNQATSNITEMHNYLKKFTSAHTEHALLTSHIALAERIAETTKSKFFDRKCDIERFALEQTAVEEIEEYIESSIAKQDPLPSVLRLLALMSLTSGIRSKKFDLFRKDLLNTYGYEHLLNLQSLERIGLISMSKRPFDKLKKMMRLLVNYGEMSNPTDYSYVYWGYAPLLVRMIESSSKGGWKNDAKSEGGMTFDYRQDNGVNDVTLSVALPRGAGTGGAAGAHVKQDKIDAAAAAAAATTNGANGDSGGVGVSKKKRIVLVFIIGGCTYAEANALRWLSERDDHEFEYVIATTHMVNGNTFVSGMLETIVNRLGKGTDRPRTRSRAGSISNSPAPAAASTPSRKGSYR